MAFDVKLEFTGITGLVGLQQDGRDHAALFVMPDAQKQEITGVPCTTPPPFEAELIRHRAFCTFPASTLPGNGSGPGEVIWYTHGMRIFLDAEFEGEAPRLRYGSFDFIPRLDEAIGPVELDPACLALNVPPARVATQVIVPHGLVEQGVADAGRWEWKTFGEGGWDGPPVSTCQNTDDWKSVHRIQATFGNVTSFSIRAVRFDGTEMGSVKLDGSAAQDNELAVRFANFCDRNPLEWPAEEPSLPDVDFQWHYSLLTPAASEAMARQHADEDLGSLTVPVPLAGAIGGVNCPPFWGGYVDVAETGTVAADGGPSAEQGSNAD